MLIKVHIHVIEWFLRQTYILSRFEIAYDRIISYFNYLLYLIIYERKYLFLRLNNFHSKPDLEAVFNKFALHN